MRTKKKTVEQKKNRNSQKSVKSVQLMGMGVYGGKDLLLLLFLTQCFKLCKEVSVAISFDEKGRTTGAVNVRKSPECRMI